MLTEAVFSKQALVVKLNAELDRRSAALTKCGEEITTLRRKEGALRKELEQSNALEQDESPVAPFGPSLPVSPFAPGFPIGPSGPALPATPGAPFSPALPSLPAVPGFP